MQQPNYFRSLDSLRGIAALMVFFYHIPTWGVSVKDFAIVHNSCLMVFFFFVLSGFVLMYSYGNKITNRLEFRDFILLRFGRIYPVHLTLLLLFLLVEIAKYVAEVEFGIKSVSNAPFEVNTIGAFFEQLFLVRGLGFSGHATTFNGQAWSISTEFYTYILFGASIVWLRLRHFFVFALTIVCASLLTFIYFSSEIGGFSGILICVAGFFLGCITYTIYNAVKERQLAGGWSALVLVFLVIFLSIENRSPALDSLMLVLSALLILTLTLSPQSGINKFLNISVLRWLGTISYSLYMTHLLVIWSVNQLFRILFKVPSIFINGHMNPQLTVKQALFAYPLTITITILMSWLVFKYIEMPLRMFSRRKVLHGASVLNH